MSHTDPCVSVVVCTYNRAEILTECLQSLKTQTAEPTSYEVIIVDNNSSDNTRDICDAFTRNNLNFRYVHESRQGLSHARNRGYREARTQWICYIDDDAKAFDNYVDRILYVIRHYDFDCFGGIFLPWYKYGKPAWYRDRYATKPMEREGTGPLFNGYASGGVMVVKKSALESLGGFSTDIGMTGEKISYGEEVHLQLRMRENGMTIGFDPELQIYHLVNHYKLTLGWFMKSAYANGLDDWNTFDKKVDWLSVLKIPPRQFLYLVQALIHHSPELFHKDYYLQNWVIDVFAPLARSVGQFYSGMRHIILTTASHSKQECKH